MSSGPSTTNSPDPPTTAASTSPQARRSEITWYMDIICLNLLPISLTIDYSLQDLGDLRQLFVSYPGPLMHRNDDTNGEIATFLDQAFRAVVQEVILWAREHEAAGRYRDAEYLIRRVYFNGKVPEEPVDPYQIEDVLPVLVSIEEKMGDYPAAEMTQETLIRRRLFVEYPKMITEEQTRAIHAYSRQLFNFRKRVLDINFDAPKSVKIYIDLFIAYRLAVLDTSLLNEVSLEQNLIVPEPSGDNFCTLLHIAAKENAINLAGILIEKGASVNSRDRGYCTPLHIAAEYAGLAMIELLLANSADVEAVDEGNRTPLHAAVMAGAALPIAASLINAKADINAINKLGMTALTIAVLQDLSAIALLLIEQGANIEGSEFSEATPPTPLFIAVNYKREWAIKLLLENGASLVERNARGDTALYVAVAEAQESVVQIMLNHGTMAKTVLDQQKGLEGTVLHRAVRGVNLSIVSMLLEAGADVNAEDYTGKPALHLAVMEGRETHENIVRLLLAHSAPLDALNRDGNTVFHLAVAYRRRNMIPILLLHVEPGRLPAICRARNNWGETPLSLARRLAKDAKEYSNERSVLYLLENALELSQSFTTKDKERGLGTMQHV